MHPKAPRRAGTPSCNGHAHTHTARSVRAVRECVGEREREGEPECALRQAQQCAQYTLCVRIEDARLHCVSADQSTSNTVCAKHYVLAFVCAHCRACAHTREHMCAHTYSKKVCVPNQNCAHTAIPDAFGHLSTRRELSRGRVIIALALASFNSTPSPSVTAIDLTSRLVEI